MKLRKRLTKKEANYLGLVVKEDGNDGSNARYMLSEDQIDAITLLRCKPNERNFVETQIKKGKDGETLSTLEKLQSEPVDIPDNFEVIKISTSKTTGQQWIQYAPKKENILEIVEGFDFKSVIQQYINPLKKQKPFDNSNFKDGKDFDTLTYTDVHIGMDSNSDNNTMYVRPWNKIELFKSADELIRVTLQEQESNILYVDDLGDFLDGFDGMTTRKGHALPQNMTNKEAFDYGLEFKMRLLYGLVDSYEEIHFNNICNDNHSGDFGYFVNEAFKQIAEIQFNNVKVVNHVKFINHYFVGDICFLISHGKDDKSLKFGFKPFLDLKGADKIDQYCKQYGIYKTAKLIIFKKGDSHQALFDMCTSDDFFYFNYPALSPSSNWIKNNFKLGRRGFVNESFKGVKNYLKPNFILCQ